MQFMLLLYAHEKAGLALPEAEMDAWMLKMNTYADALKKAGAHIAHGALGATVDASTVHLDNGQMQVHRGPFAETLEQLGGYYVIKAKDRDEANSWAAKCPAAIWGHIEVREISYAG
jgi:hypothetical protein